MTHPPETSRATPAADAATARPRQGTEIELKLAVRPGDRRRLVRRLDLLAAPASAQLHSIYFDTADARLRAAGIALRLRRRGGAADTGVGTPWIQTIKRERDGGALSRRDEWERPVAGARPSLRGDAAQRQALPAGLRAATLMPRFETRFARTTWTIASGRALLEVALDEGRIVAGHRSAPLLELELEVLQGPPEAAVALAIDLVGPASTRPRAGLGLRPVVQSKAERGWRLALAGSPVGAPVPAGIEAFARSPRGDAPAALALRYHVATAGRLLLANTDGIVGDCVDEHIHQARVALRRLREAVRLFGDAASFPPDLAEELRWIGGALGRARDADVLALETLPELLSAAGIGPRQRGRAAVARAVDAARRRERAALTAELQSPRFARLALRLIAWCLEPDPAAGPGSAPDKAGAPTFRQAGSEALRRAQDAWRRAARPSSRGSASGRHRLRLRTKRLRYLLEMLPEGTLPARAAGRQRRLRTLQDALGRDQDLSVARAFLDAAGLAPALAAGLHEAARQRQREAVDRAMRLVRRIRR